MLMEIQEDLVEYLLPRLDHLLKYLVLNGGVPCPAVCPNYVHHIVELDDFPQLVVKYDEKRLPDHLYNSNSVEIFASFG